MEVVIDVYDKTDQVTTTMTVECLTDNTFKMIENDLFNRRLTRGTEFETVVNKDGVHEVNRVLKKSDLTTHRYSLPAKYSIANYRTLGDELIARGGFWQVDFASYLTVNIPGDFPFDLDGVIEELGLEVTKIEG